MKPIKLSVSGLHSFREKQEIDFSVLCEGGVFGIFGPTGSGKSSLLDAMTLALYGKVERALNNTQGIMNHAENELAVTFVFELSNADGVKCYQIERTFKRTDELRLKTATCRLLEVADETYVMADKMNEVNQQVQEILGLTIEDFTRAVVLPQGKFAEFLSLKGSDRRKMLQRLFNLEKYGDQLNDRIRNKVQETKAELSAITSEQAGLGDASKEALENAKEKLKNAEQELVNREKELQQLEEQLEQDKQIWQWQKEKLELKRKQVGLNEQKDSIDEIESQLKRAEEAEKLKPYLEEYMDVLTVQKETENKLKNVREKLEIVKVEHHQSLLEYEKRKEERNDQESKLIVRIEQLKQAQKIMIEVADMEKDLEQLKELVSKNKNDLIQEKKKLDHANALRDKALVRRQQLKDDFKDLSVSVDEREMFRKALEAKREVVSLRKNLNELIEEQKRKKKSFDKEQNRFEKVSEQKETSKSKLISSFERSERIYHYVCQRETEIEQLTTLLKGFLEREQQALEDQKTKYLAERLSKQLQTGESCPVCGSKEHPNPAGEHKDDQLRDYENKIKNLEGNLTGVAENKQLVTEFKLQLEQLASFISDAIPNEVQVSRSKSTYEVELIVDIEKARKSEEACFDYFEQISVEIKGLRQDLLQLNNKVKEERAVYQEIKQQMKEIEYTVKMSQGVIEELQEKINSTLTQIHTGIESWKKQFEHCDFDTIEQELNKLLEKDKKASEIQAGLEKSVPFIEEKEQEISSLKEIINQHEIKQAERSTSLKQIEQNLKSKKEALQSDIGDEDIEQLLQTAQKKLESLTTNEKGAYTAFQEKLQLLQQCQSELAAAEQSHKDVQLRFEKADLKWNESLSSSIFEDLQQVKAAFIIADQQLNMKAEIDQYKDQVKQLNSELNKLNQLLQERTITEEEWINIQANVKELKAQLSQAREEKGAANELLQEINKKHQRFNELELKRKNFEVKNEKLGKLQQVFRGNAFVEFIAEEQLHQVSLDASERLSQLTRGRYAIEVDSSGGFIIRDDANGGVRRPVSTLSGGETFLTSLALALSLSAQIQLRGQYPLEFFFLDEGFGTLDQELLDTVVTALEKLHSNRLSVGVISHVQELRARLPRKLVVEPAEPSGGGSKVKLEVL